MNKITLFLLSFMTLGVVNAQNLENELGFIYVKADYLLETDRYEEAIAEFSKIIDKDPAYKDALYKRASSKFAIAAFLGTKNDLLKGFEVAGITPEAIILYGKALENLNESDAATITQKTASMLSKGSSKGSKSNRNSSKSSKSGSSNNDKKTSGDVIRDEASKIDDKVGTILDQILGKEDDREGEGSDTNNESNNGGSSETDIIKKRDEPEIEEEPEYVPDTSENELFIDEDLTIIIQDGLGGRKLLNQPNILILNETSGNISVDVCVNQNGKVTSAVFNKNASSLSTQSLVSLAVRKSKEFWFEKSREDEVCGTFIFKISGRN